MSSSVQLVQRSIRHVATTQSTLHRLRRQNYPRISQFSTIQTPRPTYTRVVPLLIGLGALVGTSFYLLYPDASRSAPTSINKTISPSYFTPATIISNESCGPDTKLLQLTIPPNLLPSRNSSDAPFGPIWSVFIKDDDIQVERPYTPLEGIDEDGRMLFWIKKYPKGEVGRWLHSKNGGEQIELRGPIKTWPWKDGVWDEIVMISGGTGITPFYQLFHNLISRQSESNKTRFTLLHSSRSPSNLPPPRILDALSTYATDNPERFSLHLFVDSVDEPPQPFHRGLKIGRIGKAAIEECLGLHSLQNNSWWSKFFTKPEAAKPLPQKVLFLVCGPEPMINAISGPYGRNFSQGLVGGVLGEMGLTSNQVWKL